jgi:hypothetical protein
MACKGDTFLRNVGKRSTDNTRKILTTDVKHGVLYETLQEEQSSYLNGLVSIMRSPISCCHNLRDGGRQSCGTMPVIRKLCGTGVRNVK